MPEDDPKVVSTAVNLLYGFSFDDNRDNEIPAIVLLAKLYGFADKYSFSGLKNLMRTTYKDEAKKSWNSTAFSTSIKFVYELTPPGDRCLRDVVVELAAKNASHLFKANAAFAETMDTVGQFGKDLTMELSRRLDARLPSTWYFPCR